MQRTLEDRHVFADDFVENGGDVEVLYDDGPSTFCAQRDSILSGMDQYMDRLKYKLGLKVWNGNED